MNTEIRLRRLLASAHNHHAFGIVYTGMYVDDGELQCAWCGCDFMRDSPEILHKKIQDFNHKKLKEQDEQSRSGPAE